MKGSIVGSVNVKLKGELETHLQQQIGDNGLYENASEYVRALIRNDLKDGVEAWEWLRKGLEPELRADENEFMAVSADDVIARNAGK